MTTMKVALINGEGLTLNYQTAQWSAWGSLAHTTNGALESIKPGEHVQALVGIQSTELSMCFLSYKLMAHIRWSWLILSREHVYRRHKLPVTCHRCSLEFQSDAALKEHSKLLIPCNVAEAGEAQGYDNDQERKLRSRKRPPGQTEADKWKEMFRILFPDDREIPSPCKI